MTGAQMDRCVELFNSHIAAKVREFEEATNRRVHYIDVRRGATPRDAVASVFHNDVPLVEAAPLGKGKRGTVERRGKGRCG